MLSGVAFDYFNQWSRHLGFLSLDVHACVWESGQDFLKGWHRHTLTAERVLTC